MSGCPLNTRTRNRGDRAGTAPLGEREDPREGDADGAREDARRHRRACSKTEPELMPVSADIGVGGMIRRSGLWRGWSTRLG